MENRKELSIKKQVADLQTRETAWTLYYNLKKTVGNLDFFLRSAKNDEDIEKQVLKFRGLKNEFVEIKTCSGARIIPLRTLLKSRTLSDAEFNKLLVDDICFSDEKYSVLNLRTFLKHAKRCLPKDDINDWVLGKNSDGIYITEIFYSFLCFTLEPEVETLQDRLNKMGMLTFDDMKPIPTNSKIIEMNVDMPYEGIEKDLNETGEAIKTAERKNENTIDSQLEQNNPTPAECFVNRVKDIMKKAAEKNGQEVETNAKGHPGSYIYKVDGEKFCDVMDEFMKEHEGVIKKYLGENAKKKTAYQANKVAPFIGYIIDSHCFSKKEMLNKDIFFAFMHFEYKESTIKTQLSAYSYTDESIELAEAFLDFAAKKK